MNDHVLFEMVKRADPLAADVGELPHELLERVLATPRPESKPRRTPRWQVRFALVAVVLGLSAVVAGLAIAGTGWLIGSPAPANVKSDFGTYSTQLGFNPQPGKALLVAGNGDYQLYATRNKQGGLCTLVGTPWYTPGSSGEGGDCSANPPDASAFWAGIGGMANAPNATTLVLDGHTTDAGAASVQFDGPNGEPVTAPVAAGGFFIVGTTVSGSICDWAAWTPRFTVLDGNGHQLSATSVTILPGARKFAVRGRGLACAAVAHGPFGTSVGQLPPGR
jgi:hypothetical protein